MITNFKTPQTTFHLAMGYKHLLFGIDKEHIIAKAETNISILSKHSETVCPKLFSAWKFSIR